MIRVASVIPSLAVRCGGPIINLVESVPHLRAAGADVTIFTTDMGAPAAAAPRRATAEEFPAGAKDCDVRVFRTERPRRFAYSPALKRALRSDLRAFDLVRIHGLYLYPQWVASAAAQRCGLPYIVTPHGALDPWIRRRGRLRKAATAAVWQDRMLRNASALHATTQTELDLFRDVVPANSPRRVVGNGVAISQFAELPSRGSLRRELGLDSDKPVLLFLGRLSRKKGLELLVRAVARMPVADVALVIVGPDDEGLTKELVDLAARVGIAGRTHFVGPRYGEQRLAALADADIWILPSYTENFGNAAIEAMAAGVPVVMTTEVNLAADVVTAGAGCVVSCDASALAAACTRLLEEPHERRRLSAAGQDYAANYDWPRISTQLAAMFEEYAR